MLTQEDLQSIKNLFEGLEQKMDSGFDHLEQRMDGLEQRMDSMESYMHKKFALMENDLIPKVNALYEATDLYVLKMEYRKRNEDVESKLEYGFTPFM